MAGPATQSPRALWFLHLAFMLSLVIYSLVGIVLRSVRPESDPVVTPEGAVGTFLFGFSLISLAMAVVVPRLVTGVVDPGALSPDELMARRMRQLVITDAFLEVPAILALIGSFIGMVPWQIGLMIGLSLAGMALMIPWIRGWIEEIGAAAARG